MFIEGAVNKTHLEFMEKAGWEIDWKIEDAEQAKHLKATSGIDVGDEFNFDEDTYVRLYLDTDIESYITPKMIVDNLEKADLPMAVTCDNNKIKELAITALKEWFEKLLKGAGHA